jgi:cell division protein FtsQ
MKKINWKNILVQCLWLILGVGTIILLEAALRKKDNKTCVDVKVEFIGTENEQFSDEEDVMDLLNSDGAVIGKGIAQIDLKSLENALKKNLWVKNAEIFFDNNEMLHVKVEERQPLVRVFTIQGNSFYLDSNAIRLPLSTKLSIRVPVITGFPSDNKVLSLPDSSMLLNVVKFGKYIKADSFWMAQVSQIVITPQATFEMIPTMGNQIVEFGDADNLDSKFNRLYSFYKQTWLQRGIDKYKKLYVQFDNQVVAVKQNIENISGDTLKSKQLVFDNSVNRSLILQKNRLAIVRPKPPINIVTSNKDSVYKLKEPLNAIHKNVIMGKQNKVTNKSLSHKHKVIKQVKQSLPAANMNLPKALMSKE